MARLRYNGLKAALSGAHNNSTTTLTFAAALSYNNGTAVPTISGSDYFMLTILNGSGDLAEIVKVTAYTSGATTATVVRGESGTTGVSHSSGAVVVQSPTSGDFQTVVKAVRTSGDLSFNTTGWQNVDTGLDLTLSAQVGDEIEFTPNFVVGSPNNQLAFDVATIVSGSVVNYFGTTGGAAENGVSGWLTPGSATYPVSGSAFYTVQSGDLSSGSVTLRLRVRPANTTTRAISASTSSPLRVTARNCR